MTPTSKSCWPLYTFINILMHSDHHTNTNTSHLPVFIMFIYYLALYIFHQLHHSDSTLFTIQIPPFNSIHMRRQDQPSPLKIISFSSKQVQNDVPLSFLVAIEVWISIVWNPKSPAQK
ncbi:hypothetical protein GDO78_000066 [Eleutherodactylus coqui]|uniref:Transmembrane protein n=1 Tax=Eleutherodactylus coqui TaxID=57060 RepID=A0A8J6FQW7_ELECQ|nr:hypothetical protein GDO78_000066 [Eleutherodactylus coqui]